MENLRINKIVIDNNKSSSILPNIGLAPKKREQIVEVLQHVLANSYLLLLKTHNYHWNVRGPLFYTVHNLTEVAYEELHTAVDDIAERIRALGMRVEAGLQVFGQRSTIEDNNHNNRADEMVKELLEGNEAVARLCRTGVDFADKASDEATADLLTARLIVHEKTSWMYRSLLEE